MDGSPTDPPGSRGVQRLDEAIRHATMDVDAFRHLLVLIAENERQASPEIVAWLEAGLDQALDHYVNTIRSAVQRRPTMSMRDEIQHELAETLGLRRQS